MNLLDPGLVVEEYRKELVDNLTLGKQSSRIFPSEGIIGREKIEQLAGASRNSNLSVIHNTVRSKKCLICCRILP